MSRRAATFRQSDLERALRAAKSVGLEVARIEVEASGKIRIYTVADNATIAENPLDKWMTSRARAS